MKKSQQAKKTAETKRKKYQKEKKDTAKRLMVENREDRINRKVAHAHKRLDQLYDMIDNPKEPGSTYDDSGYPIQLPKSL